MKVRYPIRSLTVVQTCTAYLQFLALALSLVALAVIAVAHHQAIQAAEAEKEQATAQLLGCMNGTARWESADGYDIGCMPAVVNKKKGGVR